MSEVRVIQQGQSEAVANAAARDANRNTCDGAVAFILESRNTNQYLPSIYAQRGVDAIQKRTA